MLLLTRTEQIWCNARVDLLLVILSLRPDTMTYLRSSLYIHKDECTWSLMAALSGLPSHHPVHLPVAPYAQSLNSMKLAVGDATSPFLTQTECWCTLRATKNGNHVVILIENSLWLCVTDICTSPDKLWASWLVELHVAFFISAADMNRNFSVIEFGG